MQSPLQARFMRGMDKLETSLADEEKQFNASEAAAQPLRDREMFLKGADDPGTGPHSFGKN